MWNLRGQVEGNCGLLKGIKGDGIWKYPAPIREQNSGHVIATLLPDWLKGDRIWKHPDQRYIA